MGYEKLIVSELLLIISIYIHSTYELKMDSRISTNGSGKNDAEDFFIFFFFFLNSCFSIFIYHLLFLSYDHVDHRYKLSKKSMNRLIINVLFFLRTLSHVVV